MPASLSGFRFSRSIYSGDRSNWCHSCQKTPVGAFSTSLSVVRLWGREIAKLRCAPLQHASYHQLHASIPTRITASYSLTHSASCTSPCETHPMLPKLVTLPIAAVLLSSCTPTPDPQFNRVNSITRHPFRIRELTQA